MCKLAINYDSTKNAIENHMCKYASTMNLQKLCKNVKIDFKLCLPDQSRKCPPSI
jgi:hypothetical protein